MAILVVNYPNIAPGTELEVQGYGLFKNGTSNEVPGPLYQNTHFKDVDDEGNDIEWFADVEVDTLVLGQPLGSALKVDPVIVDPNLDDEGDN
jgi:hypothetical protein